MNRACGVPSASSRPAQVTRELSEPVRVRFGGVSLPRLLDLAHAVGREQLADRARQHLAGGDPLSLLGLEL